MNFPDNVSVPHYFDIDPAATNPASRYLAVDPQTLGKLRILSIGDVELRLDGHQLLVRGTSVALPRKEFVLLQQLMDNAGRVVTRRELLDNAWGPDRAQDRNYLEVHIRRLRVKIETDANRPTHIRTVRGIGYIFDLPATQNRRRLGSHPARMYGPETSNCRRKVS